MAKQTPDIFRLAVDFLSHANGNPLDDINRQENSRLANNYPVPQAKAITDNLQHIVWAGEVGMINPYPIDLDVVVPKLRAQFNASDSETDNKERLIQAADDFARQLARKFDIAVLSQHGAIEQATDEQIAVLEARGLTALASAHKPSIY